MKKTSILTLLALEFLIVFEMSMVMPLSPVIARVYDISQDYVTWLNVGFTLAGFIAPILGRFADRFSMKKMMMISLASFILGALGIAWTSTVVAYFIFRFFIGIGYYTLLSLIVSYASLIIKKENYTRFSGAIKVAFASGVLVAPLLCSWIEQTFSYQGIYLMLAAAGMLLLGLLSTIEDANGTASVSVKLVHLLSDRVIRRMIFICFLICTPSVYVYTFTSISLSGYGIDQYSISLIYTIIALGSLSAGIIIMGMGQRFSLYRGLLAGIACVIVALPFFPLRLPLLYGVGFLFGFGYDLLWGCFYPYAATLKPQVSGSFLTLLSLGMALSNLVNQLIGPLILQAGGYLSGLILVIVAFGLAGYLLYQQRHLQLG